jgi:site-specific DNA-methyltransferase (cytosine-N4-specific)
MIHSKALEMLAFYFARLLGLEFENWQKRKIVKLLANETELLFSRWQIRCQNSLDSDVLLDDLAEEVGLSLKFKSNVILIVTTGEFSNEALRYADEIMRSTSLNIITINGQELDALAKSPHIIVDMLNSKASDVVQLKALEKRRK